MRWNKRFVLIYYLTRRPVNLQPRLQPWPKAGLYTSTFKIEPSKILNVHMCTHIIQTQCWTAGFSDYFLLDREKENMLWAITKGSVGQLCASQSTVCRDSALAALTLSSSRLVVHMNIKERWETERRETEWRKKVMGGDDPEFSMSGCQIVVRWRRDNIRQVCVKLCCMSVTVTWSVSMVSVEEKSRNK